MATGERDPHRLCWFSLLLLFALFGGIESKKNYIGYSTYRVNVCSKADAKLLTKLEVDIGVMFWSRPSTTQNYADVMVSPETKRTFINSLNRNNLEYVTIDNDVSEKLRRLEIRNNTRMGQRGRNGVYNVSRYMTYREMEFILEHLALTVDPNTGRSIAILENIGKSYEGRNLYMIKISTDHNARKPVILIDAGMHAREWSTTPTALYLAQQLTQNMENNMDMLENFDFYIIPMMNPDGYEYSRLLDPLWRKTRSPQANHCFGVDGNRNFDFHWGESGASDNPCSGAYSGVEPFSEAETKALRDVAINYQPRILMYISLHSYGGLILYPFGYSRLLPPSWKKLDICAKEYVASIKGYSGTEYQHGSASHILYEAAGGSDDWFLAVRRVPFSYTIELPATMQEAFYLDPQKLPTLGKETMVGIKSLAECALRFKDQNF